ncbi:sigma-54-dependent Fis family transcriptional regulator [uncultured Umboniibacter sp.]|uniref:sigma-54 dependent transcriptional regulator n=1 Tax=uncultured Umboniibacter sp. TaxID=1798917 RepID=UPI00261B8755|nr:sigma-54-dependent Fis family transcriptional regulator [uncultured Umboniibacter sp.]
MYFEQDVVVFVSEDSCSVLQGAVGTDDEENLDIRHADTLAKVLDNLDETRSNKKRLILLESHFLSDSASSISAVAEFGDLVVIVQSHEESMVSFALANGAVDYLVAPFDRQLLELVVQRIQSPVAEDLVVKSPAGKRTFHLAHRIAQVDASVLLQGQSGVGKEVVAQYIHEHSRRSQQPFVAINCAAIPDSMAEAVLFGHTKGAFTGATEAHSGKFEEANGGTLFLDEVSELSLPIQAKLLRVIQEREVERVGSHKRISLDIRILAAANVSLSEQVTQQHFRNDLYYRLAVLELDVPPLRDRKDDIEPLARLFLAKCDGEHCTMTPQFINGLTQHDWPGNIRELQNIIQRAFTFRNSNNLDLIDLQSAGLVRAEVDNPASIEHLSPFAGISSIRKRSEFQLVLKVLREVNGTRKLAAQRLGISTRALRYKLNAMKNEGIDIETLIAEVA